MDINMFELFNSKKKKVESEIAKQEVFLLKEIDALCQRKLKEQKERVEEMDINISLDDFQDTKVEGVDNGATPPSTLVSPLIDRGVERSKAAVFNLMINVPLKVYPCDDHIGYKLFVDKSNLSAWIPQMGRQMKNKPKKKKKKNMVTKTEAVLDEEENY